MSNKKNKDDLQINREEDLIKAIDELASQGYLKHKEAVNYIMIKKTPLSKEGLFVIRADAARRRRKKKNRFKYFKTVIESLRSFIGSLKK